MKKRFLFIVPIVALVAGAASYAYLSWRDSSRRHTAQTVETATQEPSAADCIAKLPLETLIAQKLMYAARADQLSQVVPVLKNNPIGGIIVMDEMSSSQIAQLVSAPTIPPSIAVDQEGGSVQRFTTEGELPGEQAMATQYSATQAHDLYLRDNKYLKSLGITTNFAPMLGVNSKTDSPFADRMYSSDSATVASYGEQSVRAAQEAGITPVIKHFPGLGSASKNTDYEPATVDPLATLRTRDLMPYVKLASLKPDVMVSSAIVPDLTNGQPAVWSAPAVELLRSMGYEQSVLYTDSLTAEAIPGKLSDAVIKSWKAGIDVALIVQKRENIGDLPHYTQLIFAAAKAALDSGELQQSDIEASVARILSRKSVDPCALQG